MNDLRYRKNHKRIISEFEELLLNKDYEAITISKICEKSEVSRSAFYDHFENKDELLKEVYNQFMVNFSSYVTHTFDEEYAKEYIIKAFKHTTKNERIIRIVLKVESEDFLRKVFIEQLDIALTKANIQFKRKDIRELYLNTFAACAIETIQWWLEYGMKDECYDEVAEMILGCLNKGMNPTFFN